MGDRGQVHIKDEGVWLYTHWEATELLDNVKRALSKRWRWNDPEYLARIIFDEMVGGYHGEETGFGISTSEHSDVWIIITINCEEELISVKDNGEITINCSFSDFISV